MRLFSKKRILEFPEAYDFISMKKDTRYDNYCDHAHDLPLLTDEELKRFALTGEQTVISSTSLGVSWTSSVNTQFLIRLRRTLLTKSDEDNISIENNAIKENDGIFE